MNTKNLWLPVMMQMNLRGVVLKKKKPDTRAYKLWIHLYKVQRQATSSTATEVIGGLIFGRRCELIRTAIGNVLYLDLGGGDMDAFLYVKIHQVIYPIFVHLYI